MKAARYDGIGKVEVRDVPRQVPAAGHVLIDTQRAGICGSDLHSYLGRWQQWEKNAPGHELSGVIAEVGEGVSDWQAGDRVAIECKSHCGTCDLCRTGNYNQCRNRSWFAGDGHGGLAEFTTAHASTLFRLPEGLSFDLGALMEPLSVGVRAVAQGRPLAGETVAVIGAGSIGLCCLAAARERGLERLFAVAKYPHQRDLATAFGAAKVAEPEAAVEELAAFTDRAGADLVVETAGSEGALAAALSMVRPCGRIVLVAGYGAPVPAPLARVVSKEVTLVGSNCYAWSGMRRDSDVALSWLARGRLPYADLITHRFSLDDADLAYRTAADKASGAVKVMICQ